MATYAGANKWYIYSAVEAFGVGYTWTSVTALGLANNTLTINSLPSGGVGTVDTGAGVDSLYLAANGLFKLYLYNVEYVNGWAARITYLNSLGSWANVFTTDGTLVSINTGQGNDNLTVTGNRSTTHSVGSYGNTINLGAGNDYLTLVNSITRTGVDKYDGGVGTNTLELRNTTNATVIDSFGNNNDIANFQYVKLDNALNGNVSANFSGQAEALYLTENRGDNIITGGSGNDTILAAAGNDFIYGGDGNDYIVAGSGYQTIDGGNGNDTIFGGTSLYNANAGQPGTRVTGGAGADAFYVGYTDSVATVQTAATVTTYATTPGVAGKHVATGNTVITDWQNGTDSLNVSSSGVAMIGGLYGQANLDGNDTVVVNANVTNDGLLVIRGGTGNDTLLTGVYSGNGSEYVYGNAGHNTVYLNGSTPGSSTATYGGTGHAVTFYDTIMGNQSVVGFNAAKDVFAVDLRVINALAGTSTNESRAIGTGGWWNWGTGYGTSVNYLYGHYYYGGLGGTSNGAHSSTGGGANYTTHLEGAGMIAAGAVLMAATFGIFGASLIVAGSLLEVNGTAHQNMTYNGVDLNALYLSILNNNTEPATSGPQGAVPAFLDFFGGSNVGDGFTPALEFTGTSGPIHAYVAVHSSSETFVYLINSPTNVVTNGDAIEVARINGWLSAGNFAVYNGGSTTDPYAIYNPTGADPQIVLLTPTITSVTVGGANVPNYGVASLAGAPALNVSLGGSLSSAASVVVYDGGTLVQSGTISAGATTFTITDTRSSIGEQISLISAAGGGNGNVYQFMPEQLDYAVWVTDPATGFVTKSQLYVVNDSAPNPGIAVDGGAASANNTIILTQTSGTLNTMSDSALQHIQTVDGSSASTAITVDLSVQSEGFAVVGSTAGGNTLIGGQGANTLQGEGRDSLTGGSGNDVFHLSGGGNIVIDTAGVNTITAGANTSPNYYWFSDSYSGGSYTRSYTNLITDANAAVLAFDAATTSYHAAHGSATVAAAGEFVGNNASAAVAVNSTLAGQDVFVFSGGNDYLAGTASNDYFWDTYATPGVFGHGYGTQTVTGYGVVLDSVAKVAAWANASQNANSFTFNGGATNAGGSSYMLFNNGGSTTVFYAHDANGDGAIQINSSEMQYLGEVNDTPANLQFLLTSIQNHTLASLQASSFTNVAKANQVTIVSALDNSHVSGQVDLHIGNGQLTGDNTPTLNGWLGQPLANGQTLQVLDGANPLGGTLTWGGDNMTWAFTPSAALADGTHNLTVEVVDPNATVEASSTFTLTVDTQAPTAFADMSSAAQLSKVTGHSSSAGLMYLVDSSVVASVATIQQLSVGSPSLVSSAVDVNDIARTVLPGQTYYFSTDSLIVGDIYFLYSIDAVGHLSNPSTPIQITPVVSSGLTQSGPVSGYGPFSVSSTVQVVSTGFNSTDGGGDMVYLLHTGGADATVLFSGRTADIYLGNFNTLSSAQAVEAPFLTLTGDLSDTYDDNLQMADGGALHTPQGTMQGTSGYGNSSYLFYGTITDIAGNSALGNYGGWLNAINTDGGIGTVLDTSANLNAILGSLLTSSSVRYVLSSDTGYLNVSYASFNAAMTTDAAGHQVSKFLWVDNVAVDVTGDTSAGIVAVYNTSFGVNEAGVHQTFSSNSANRLTGTYTLTAGDFTTVARAVDTGATVTVDATGASVAAVETLGLSAKVDFVDNVTAMFYATDLGSGSSADYHLFYSDVSAKLAGSNAITFDLANTNGTLSTAEFAAITTLLNTNGSAANTLTFSDAATVTLSSSDSYIASLTFVLAAGQAFQGYSGSGSSGYDFIGNVAGGNYISLAANTVNSLVDLTAAHASGDTVVLNGGSATVMDEIASDTVALYGTSTADLGAGHAAMVGSGVQVYAYATATIVNLNGDVLNILDSSTTTITSGSATIGVQAGIDSLTVAAGDHSDITVAGGASLSLSASGVIDTALAYQTVAVSDGALTLGAYESGFDGVHQTLTLDGVALVDLGASAGDVHAHADVIDVSHTGLTATISNFGLDFDTLKAGATALLAAGQMTTGAIAGVSDYTIDAQGQISLSSLPTHSGLTVANEILSALEDTQASLTQKLAAYDDGVNTWIFVGTDTHMGHIVELVGVTGAQLSPTFASGAIQYA